MARAEHSIVVERSPDEVFAYFSDPARIGEWQASALEARLDSPGPMSVGARIKEIRKFLGRRMETLMEVTAYQPPREFSLKTVSGPVPFHVRQILESAGKGTKIDVVIEGEPGGFFKLAEPLVERAVGRELAHNLETLKDVLESKPD